MWWEAREATLTESGCEELSTPTSTWRFNTVGTNGQSARKWRIQINNLPDQRENDSHRSLTEWGWPGSVFKPFESVQWVKSVTPRHRQSWTSEKENRQT